MSTAPTPDGPLQFTPDEDRTFSGLSLSLKLAGAVVLLLALLSAVDAVVGFLAAPFTSFLLLIGAGLTFVLGRILMVGGDDAAFLVTAKGHEPAHVSNLIKSLGHYAAFLLGLAVVLLLAALVRLSG
jgi:hypothetical protein